MEKYEQGLRCPVTGTCFWCEISPHLVDNSVSGRIFCPKCGRTHTIIGTVTREPSGLISDSDITVL